MATINFPILGLAWTAWVWDHLDLHKVWVYLFFFAPLLGSAVISLLLDPRGRKRSTYPAALPYTLETRATVADWLGRTRGPDVAVGAFAELLTDCVRELGRKHPVTVTVRASLDYWRLRAKTPAADPASPAVTTRTGRPRFVAKGKPVRDGEPLPPGTARIGNMAVWFEPVPADVQESEAVRPV